MVRSAGLNSLIAAALVAVAVMFAGCSGTPVAGTTCGVDPCLCPMEPTAEPCGPPTGMPEGAQAGEAWCRVWIPPEYGTIAEKVCVEPACERQVQVPPKYGTRPKLVCVKEPGLCEKRLPAVWGVKKRPVLVCPEREEIVRVDCPNDNLGPCEIQCECYTKKVHPAVYCEEDCPVCLAPERVCVEYSPAEYKVVEERYLVSPARCEKICVPARFEMRFRETCIKPGHWEWRRNETCEVPAAPMPAPLPALQVEMQDSAESGEEAGVFSVGDTVRYDLTVSSDEGSSGIDGVKVVFTLPPELEFVKGDANGIQLTGSGQSAETASFDLGVGQSIKLHLLAKVLSSPPSNIVQLTASIRGADGTELAEETESTTLKPE